MAAATAGEPLNVRLSIGGRSEIGISWQSDSRQNCDVVFYGLDPFNLGWSARAERSCDMYKSDTFHHVVLTDLHFDTVYTYSIPCSNHTSSFRTPPRPESTGSFSWAVYADLGTVHGEPTMTALASLRDRLSGHIFAGDIGYADDAFMHGQSYVARTQEFLKSIASSSESIPVMVAPGNHECEDHTPVCLLSPHCREGFGNFSAYNCIWNMPSVNRRHSMWHSFNYGPVHFVMTNSETDYEGAPLEGYGEVGYIPTGSFGQPGEYENWLREDLVKAHQERDIRPWIIVVGHRPITVLDDQSDPFVTPMNKKIIELIGKYADAYIAGHVHYYARSSPKPGSPFQAVSITVGGAGNDEWPERRVKETRKGVTEFMEYFGYGEAQTFGILSRFEDKPDELVFELLRSRDQSLVDRVILPRRRTKKDDSPVLVTQ